MAVFDFREINLTLRKICAWCWHPIDDACVIYGKLLLERFAPVHSICHLIALNFGSFDKNILWMADVMMKDLLNKDS